MPLTTNTERRLIGDFRFSDNQLQRVMLEIRHAIHQLQGLNGAEGGTLTRAEIVQLINNLLVGITVDVEEAPVDGTPYSRQDADWVNALQDAPSNGSEYVRKDGGWAVNTGGTGSGIPDAPSDGTLYGRKDAAWEAVPDVPTDIGDLTDTGGLLGSGGIPDAPSDGTDYVRKDGAWSSAAYFSGDYGDLTNQPDIPSDIGDLTDNGNLLGGGGVEEAPNDGDKYVRQNESWVQLPSGAAAGQKWIDYATGFSSLPSLLETIAAGDVYEYTYSNGTLYRLVATDGSDKFYSSFSSPTLSGLVSEKAITI